MKKYCAIISTRKINMESSNNIRIYWHRAPYFNYFRLPNTNVLPCSKKSVIALPSNVAEEIIWDY